MMWKEILEKVVESFACADPMAYMYYVAAKQEAEARPETTAKDEADERQLLRLIDRLQARNEASA